MTSRPSVWVVGDVMADVTVRAPAFRSTQEDPTVRVFPVEKSGRGAEVTPGGAGNLAVNLAALGCAVRLFCTAPVVVHCETTRLVELAFTAAGVERHGTWLTSDEYRLTVKTRYYEDGRLVARFDDDHEGPPVRPDRDGARFTKLPTPDAVVVTDYGKGSVTPASLAEWTEYAAAVNRPVYYDPKLGRPFWRGADGVAVVANWAEACEGVGVDYAPGYAAEDQVAEDLAAAVRGATAAAVVVKRGVHGSSWSTAGCSGSVPVVAPRAVYDVQGAGDTYLAALVAGRGRGLDWADACLLASAAAGVAVGKPGTAVVTSAETVAALRGHLGAFAHGVLPLAQAVALRRRLGAFGFKVGLTSGVHDLRLHRGHLETVRHAASRCDALFVGVDSDARVKDLKGDARPVVGEADRAFAVSRLAGVAGAFVFDCHPRELLATLAPDVYVKGGDYSAATLPEVDGWDGEWEVAPRVDCHSTTDLIDRLSGLTGGVV